MSEHGDVMTAGGPCGSAAGVTVGEAQVWSEPDYPSQAGREAQT